MSGKDFFRIMRLETPLRLLTREETETDGGGVDQQVHRVVFAVELDQRCTEVPADGRKDRPQLMQDFSGKDIASLFCDKDQRNMHRKNAMPSLPKFA